MVVHKYPDWDRESVVFHKVFALVRHKGQSGYREMQVVYQTNWQVVVARYCHNSSVVAVHRGSLALERLADPELAQVRLVVSPG